MIHVLKTTKRPYVRIYLTQKLYQIIMERALLCGLPVTHYIKYIEIDPNYEFKVEKMIEDSLK